MVNLQVGATYLSSRLPDIERPAWVVPLSMRIVIH